MATNDLRPAHFRKKNNLVCLSTMLNECASRHYGNAIALFMGHSSNIPSLEKLNNHYGHTLNHFFT